MRIAFTRSVSLEAPGGGTIHSLGLACALRRLGVDVWFVTVSARHTQSKVWSADRLIEVEPFGIHPLLDGIPVAKSINDLCRGKFVDAVLSWQYEAAFLPALAKYHGFKLGIIAGFPYSAWKNRKTSLPWLKHSIDEFFRYRPLRQADMIFSPSRFSRQELLDVLGLPDKKIHITPCGIDEVFFCEITRSSSEIKKFIFSGSFEEIKGIYDTIDALRIIKLRGYKNWTLKIVSWDDPAPVINYARVCGIEEQLEFAGALSRDNFAQALAASDLAILPSHTETFGLTIAEAQAVGLPVVSYRTGAIPEIVENDVTGILVDLHDTQKLAEAIMGCIDYPQQAVAMGQSGRQRMRMQFSWEKSAKEILDILCDDFPLK